jgi:hypothetical protein
VTTADAAPATQPTVTALADEEDENAPATQPSVAEAPDAPAAPAAPTPVAEAPAATQPSNNTTVTELPLDDATSR